MAQAGELAAEDCESGPQRYWLAFAQVSAAVAEGELERAQRVCDRYAVPAAGSPQAEAIVTALSGGWRWPAVACHRRLKPCRPRCGPPAGPPAGVASMVVAAWLAQVEGTWQRPRRRAPLCSGPRPPQPGRSRCSGQS